MFSKKSIIYVSSIALCMVLIGTGCSDKPISATQNTYGLKAVSLGSEEMFKGDITQIPGYEQAARHTAVGAKVAQAAAAIPFDKAYALVVYCLESNFIYNANPCEKHTDRFNAFGKITNLYKWDTLLAGCRTLTQQEVVSVTELKKSGNFVEGTIYVKPGINDVIVVFVNDDSVTWYSERTYYNFDGWDCTDCMEGISSGWAYGWQSSEFYPWEFSVIGNLEITENDVATSCDNVPPNYPYLLMPFDGDVVPAAPLELTWSCLDYNEDQLTYTVYMSQHSPPDSIVASGSMHYIDYGQTSYGTGTITGLEPSTTYQWQVGVDDGSGEVKSFYIHTALTDTL